MELSKKDMAKILVDLTPDYILKKLYQENLASGVTMSEDEMEQRIRTLLKLGDD